MTHLSQRLQLLHCLVLYALEHLRHIGHEGLGKLRLCSLQGAIHEASHGSSDLLCHVVQLRGSRLQLFPWKSCRVPFLWTYFSTCPCQNHASDRENTLDSPSGIGPLSVFESSSTGSMDSKEGATSSDSVLGWWLRKQPPRHLPICQILPEAGNQASSWSNWSRHGCPAELLAACDVRRRRDVQHVLQVCSRKGSHSSLASNWSAEQIRTNTNLKIARHSQVAPARASGWTCWTLKLLKLNQASAAASQPDPAWQTSKTRPWWRPYPWPCRGTSRLSPASFGGPEATWCLTWPVFIEPSSPWKCVKKCCGYECNLFTKLEQYFRHVPPLLADAVQGIRCHLGDWTQLLQKLFEDGLDLFLGCGRPSSKATWQCSWYTTVNWTAKHRELHWCRLQKWRPYSWPIWPEPRHPSRAIIATDEKGWRFWRFLTFSNHIVTCFRGVSGVSQLFWLVLFEVLRWWVWHTPSHPRRWSPS